MNTTHPLGTSHASQRGQILPLFAVALFTLLLGVALVIEGGNVLAQQRMAQNVSDAAAMAGAITIAENIARPGARTGADVVASVAAAAAQTPSDGDGVSSYVATYTDGFGQQLMFGGAPIPVAAGAIPALARGVNVSGTRTGSGSVGAAVGFGTFNASADATAVAGILAAPCPPDTNCAVLPITMPVSYGQTICGSDLRSLGLTNPASAWTTISDVSLATSTNMSVLPLCITGSGDFSWLDLGPDNLQQEILNPSGQRFQVPDWIQTQPGNPNSAEGEVNTYRGRVVLIPMWQAICGADPGTINDPCTKAGANGNNTWYAIPYMRPLLLQGAYIQGDNRADCTVPGVTWPAESGKDSVPGLIGCVKGWWLDTTVTGGPIDPNVDPTDPNNSDAVIGVQLIK